MGKYEITSGTVNKAQKVVIYGVEGIGKSTFASMFPGSLFIDTEGSTSKLNVDRLPKPLCWEMLIDEVRTVINEKMCKTLIIDTADWAERMCIENVCKSRGKTGIEDFGFGNGYTYVAEEWGRFLNLLQEVIDVANINVVLTAHAILRKFEQPDEMGAYDRYELKLGKKTTNQTAPMTKEWADAVLFANYKTIVIATDKDGKKNKARGGQRVMYTSHHPCWDAKNRYGLPEECPFDYDVIRPFIPADLNEPVKVQPQFTSQPMPQQAMQTPPTNQPQMLDMAQGVGSGPVINTIDTPPVQQPVQDDYEGLPKALVDLMKANNVTTAMIKQTVAERGFLPADMEVKDYPMEFIEQMLIASWDRFYETMKNTFELPF